MGEATQPGATVEQWIYLGQSATKAHLWRDSNGVDLAYDKLKGRVVAGLYEIEVVRGERVTVYPSTLRFINRSDVDDAPMIQARALAWEVRRTSDALEKRTARLADIDEAIEPLVQLASKVIGYSNREALARYVSAKIHGA